MAVIYVDGREQSRIEDYGKGEPINLGMQNRGKDFMFKTAIPMANLPISPANSMVKSVKYVFGT